MTTETVKFPGIKITLLGMDSNAGTIMGAVTDAIKQAERDGIIERDERIEGIQTYREQAMSGDYDNLLRVTMETVDCLGGDDDG